MCVCVCSVTAGAASVNRPRSKTFEEYSKETDDIWDDKEEDFSELSSEVDNSRMKPEKGGAKPRPRTGSKGKKGVCV